MVVKIWIKEEVDELIYMVENGFKRKEIVEVLGKSFSDVSNHIKVLEIKSPLRYKEKNGLYFCPFCKTYKEKDEFHKNKNGPHGMNTYCKKCHNERVRESYKEKKFAEINKYIKSVQPEFKTKEEVVGSKFKKCTRCKEIKDVGEFCWHTTYIRIQSHCYQCRSEDTKKYLLKRIEKKGY